MDKLNRLVLIGNGFDLAHGLKTNYKDFIDWYMVGAFKQYYNCDEKKYSDPLITIRNIYTGSYSTFEKMPTTSQQVLECISPAYKNEMIYLSSFFQRLLNKFHLQNWVDIEREYFRLLKSVFANLNSRDKKEIICKLNSEFDFLISQLAKYISSINNVIPTVPELKLKRTNLEDIFNASTNNSEVKFLNFNYTETLRLKYHISQDEIIHIHGRVSDINRNPIIFGYGDESDPSYQAIEDSGENVYLEHIKSFGYFKTNNYHQLLSFIDSYPYIANIVGHSCGLSDRILLNTIFEHPNCKKIEIFYHTRNDGTDNFKEITQEMSRHFKPHNKDLMRRRVSDRNDGNFIPQNKF